MKITLNQLVNLSGLSRYHIRKLIDEHQIEGEIETRKNIKVQVFTDAQKQRILELAAQIKASKEETLETETSIKTPVENTLMLTELAAAKAKVETLLDERNYLREALFKEQENSKILSEQIANQDQRMSVVIAALTQTKELTEKASEKKSFWQRILG